MVPAGVVEPGNTAGKIDVEVRDRTGKLVTVQRFDSMDDARQFIHDLQTPQTPAGAGDSNVSPATNKF
jgi:hypothetical protein